MAELNVKQLISAALAARENAYAPYSGVTVGASLLAADGRIFSGCNIENAAYSPGICAERTAFAVAVSSGCLDFTAIAIMGGRREALAGDLAPFYPCGVCRQWMTEFCDVDFVVIVGDGADDFKKTTLAELFPYSFSAADLRRD